MKDIRYSIDGMKQEDEDRQRFIRRNAWPNVWTMGKIRSEHNKRRPM